MRQLRNLGLSCGIRRWATIGVVWVSLVVVIILLATDIGNTVYHAMMGLALILVTPSDC